MDAETIREALIEHYYDVHDTSLSKLDEHDWNVLKNRWCRGIDWCVRKIGRQWMITLDHFDGFGLFKTKRAAMEAVDKLILAEAGWRKKLELERELRELEGDAT